MSGLVRKLIFKRLVRTADNGMNSEHDDEDAIFDQTLVHERLGISDLTQEAKELFAANV